MSNNLSSWKNQGILLANTILTVEEGKPLSHKNIGWERFVSELLNTLNNTYENIIYLCFGVKAFNFASSLANIQKHIILKTSHPSPFSYKKGFENSKIFLKVNDKLDSLNKKKIDWNTY
ncbi:uracil-DNA glycosylase [Metamycoplasma orale]|uniref:uracil-DNA glycosylase n=1 Tax=Metamycoplasma orale TaxID=2121 RepID=A0A448ZWP2_METOS|nr:uracil-DNA glycosylase [Metamycoplasma orale]VEU55523.1 uracil-DNA glycosylase [Metamycoplasma orale]